MVVRNFSQKNIWLAGFTLFFIAFLGTLLKQPLNMHLKFVSALLFIISVVVNYNIKETVFSGKTLRFFCLASGIWLLWIIGVDFYRMTFMGMTLHHGTLSNFFRLALFIANTFMGARIIAYYKLHVVFMRIIITILGFFLLLLFTVYWHESLMFFSKADMLYGFSKAYVGARMRVEYGLYHANTIGHLALSFIMIFISYISLKKILLKRKLDWYLEIVPGGIVSVIAFFMCYCANSRSSISGIVVFFVLLGALLVYHKYFSRTLGGKIFSIAIIIIMFLAVYCFVDIKYILSSSGRLGNYTINLPNLTKYGMWWSGLGYIEAGAFITNKIPGFKTTYVDCYYLYVLLVSGIAGCMIYLIPMLTYVLCKFKNFSMYLIVPMAMMLTNFYLGIFETCILYDRFIASMIYWIIFIITDLGGPENNEG